jgi:hypothetical protein
MSGIARWRREPLLHFLLLGAGLLAVHRVLVPPADGAREIVVSAALRRGLSQDHLRRTGAPPTAAEEAALVRRYLEDEVLYREALALGLDRGDVIVRRRLVQKMRFLAEELDPPSAAGDADLQAWLDAHGERYDVPARTTLAHVFVDGARHGAAAAARAAALRARLRAGDDPARLGDPFLHGPAVAARTARELAAMFGPDFAARVAALPVGEWSEPLASSYGLHLVRVHARDAARRPALDEVRERVVRDWAEARRTEATRAAVARLLAAYAVRMEDGDAPGAALAAR